MGAITRAQDVSDAGKQQVPGVSVVHHVVRERFLAQ